MESFGLRVVQATGTALTVEGRVGQWEQALHTHFLRLRRDREALVRCREYFLPPGVAQHVSMVTGTVQMPVDVHHSGPKTLQPLV
jgi:hypothetical protein